MKIAHIAAFLWDFCSPGNYGGTEIVIYNLIEEQVSQGQDVTLFAPEMQKHQQNISLFFLILLLRKECLGDTPKAFYHLYRALEYANEFDIIHTHLSSSSDLYFLLLLILLPSRNNIA